MGARDLLETDLVKTFSDKLQGPVLRRDDSGYEDARTVWNGMIEKEPALIARCKSNNDVQRTVKFAREHDLLLSIKSGGHMTTGHAICDDGLVLDLSLMDDVRVDPQNQTVRVHGGATWTQVNEQALEYGLIPPGIPEDVGVGGFTLGGGLGITMRKYGLAIDNLCEVDVVTADSELITASENNHEDLFWALRGGGGNFGVVTSFEFECFDEGSDCLTAQVLYPIGSAEGFLRYFRTAMQDVPDALYPIVSFVTIPALPGIPSEYHGAPGIYLYVMSIGDPDKLDTPVGQLLEFGDHLIKIVDVMDYTQLFDPFDVPSKGQRHYWKSIYLDRISDDLIETLVEEIPPLPTPESAAIIYSLGGAIDQQEPDATAYAHRDASYLLSITTQWGDPEADEVNTTWAKKVHEAVAPHGTGGEHINNQTEDDAERVMAGYGKHYDRLVEVKNEWDPTNLFRMNQNIEPTS